MSFLIHSELNDSEFDLAEELSPKCSDILYTNRNAAAVHELLDSIEGVTVLSLHEGRMANASNNKCILLENPKLVITNNESGTDYVEEFIKDFNQIVYPIVTKNIAFRLVLEKYPLMNNETESIRYIESIGFEFRVRSTANADKEAVREEIEFFMSVIWETILYAASEADETKDFFGKYISSELKVSCQGEITERSIPGRAIAEFNDALGFEASNIVINASVRRAAKVLTSSKALFKLIGFGVSKENLYSDIKLRSDEVGPDFNLIPSQPFWRFKKKKYNYATLLLKDISKAEETPDGIVKDEDFGVKQDTFIMFSYLIGTDKLAYLSFFHSMSEIEVLSRFGELKNKDEVLECVTFSKTTLFESFTQEGLFAEIFMDIDAWMKDTYYIN